MGNYFTYSLVWDVITHPWHNFHGALTKAYQANAIVPMQLCGRPLYGFVELYEFDQYHIWIGQSPVLLMWSYAVANLLANDSTAFIWKLCCNWLKGLQQRQITVAIQSPRRGPRERLPCPDAVNFGVTYIRDLTVHFGRFCIEAATNVLLRADALQRIPSNR